MASTGSAESTLALQVPGSGRTAWGSCGPVARARTDQTRTFASSESGETSQAWLARQGERDMKLPERKGKRKLPPKPQGGGAAARRIQFEQERGMKPPASICGKEDRAKGEKD